MGVSRLSETFLGDISDVSRRTGWSAVLSSCRVAALQACETSRLGPHSPIRDQGSLCAQFRRTQCFHDLRTVPLSDRFVLTKAMSGSAPPSPSMMKDTTVLSILLEPPFTASLTFLGDQAPLILDCSL